MMDTRLFIKVHFGKGFDGIDKGPLLLEFERLARRMLGIKAEVFQDTMRDQNKLRRQLQPGDIV